MGLLVVCLLLLIELLSRVMDARLALISALHMRTLPSAEFIVLFLV
jgi:hypothetical protein